MNNTFAYGCPNDEDSKLKDSEKVYPRILSFLSDAFSWSNCVFSIPKDRKSAGRIIARTQFQIEQSFTIETSFGGIGFGEKSGVLYDEASWRNLGFHIGLSAFHYLSGKESSLWNYVSQEIALLSSSPINLGLVQVNRFAEDQAKASTDPKIFVETPNSPLLFHSFRPTSKILISDQSISVSSKLNGEPVWQGFSLGSL